MNTNRCLHRFRAALPALLFFVLLARVPAQAAALTEEQKGQTVASLEALAASPSAETTTALYEKIARGDVTAQEWAPAFREYLDKNHFSPALGMAWRGMIGTEGPGQEAAARAAGAFAAAALQSSVCRTPPNLQELDTVLQWLEQCTAFAPPLVATIATGLDSVLRGDPIDAALLGERPPGSPDAASPAPGTAVSTASPAPSDAAELPLRSDAAEPATEPAAVPAASAAGIPGAETSPATASAAAAPPKGAAVPASLVPPTGGKGAVPARPANQTAGAATPPSAAALPAPPQKAATPGAKDKLKKPDTTPMPGAAFPAPAMQVAITLGYYAGPENIGAWMRLPDASQLIYRASGVWVFDGGMLAPPQVQSLGSLLTAMPAAVSGVSVVAMMQLPFSLRAPGVVLPLAPVLPELQRPPVVLPPGVMLPAIPEFTATAARALGELIQQRELARRPELAKRRDVLLLIAGERADSALPAFLAPGGYAGSGDFFPALTVLWLTGSEAALNAASALSGQGDHESIYALLLLADLLSCGGDTTLVFSTGTMGQVVGGQAALRRNFVEPGHVYITGVAAGGTMFSFDGIEYEILTQL